MPPASITQRDKNALKEAMHIKQLATTSFRNKHYDVSIKHFNKAIEKCPRSSSTQLASLYESRAAVYEQLKQWPHVITDCSKILKYNKFSVKAYLLQAKAHKGTNCITECLKDIASAIVIQENAKKKISNATYEYFDSIAIETGVEDAKLSIDNEDHTLLPSSYEIERYFRLLAQDPICEEIFEEVDPKGYVRAKIAFDKSNYEDIIPACTEEITFIQSSTVNIIKSLLLRGTFYMLSGSFKKARLDLNEVIQSKDVEHKILANAFSKRGYIHFLLENDNEGFKDFEKTEQIIPLSSNIPVHLGLLYMLSNQFEDAVKQLKKAASNTSNSFLINLYKCTAELYLAQKSTDSTKRAILMNEIDNIIEYSPDNYEGYELKAVALTKQQKFSEANTFFKKAINIAPKTGLLYVYQALLMLKWKNDKDFTIALLKKAITVDSKCTMAYQLLGDFAESYDEAITFYKKAIETAKTPLVLQHLFKLKNIALAKRHAYAKLFPSNN